MNKGGWTFFELKGKYRIAYFYLRMALEKSEMRERARKYLATGCWFSIGYIGSTQLAPDNE